MSDKKASLILSLKDEVTDGLKKIGLGALSLTGIFAGLTAFLVSSTKEFLESEKAANKLNIALRNQGVYSAETSAELIRYAAQLQRTTTFSDEAIVETESLLTTFGIAGEELKKTTQAALDLSSGLGIDLRTATLILGKAAAGETGTLSRYGIQIDENIPKAKKLEEVLKVLNERFGGAAQSELNTTSGRIANLSNKFSDLKEEIGTGVLPYLESFLEKIAGVISGVEQLGGVFNAIFLVGLSTFKDFLLTLDLAMTKIPLLGPLFELTGTGLAGVTQKIQEQIDKLILLGNQEQASANKSVSIQNTTSKTKIENQRKWNKEEEIEKLKQEEKFKKINEERVKRDLDHIDRIREANKKANEDRVKNIESTLNFISTLSTSHNKTLAAIGKAAAISTATIDTYRAINVALRSAPPPYNFALAALVGTAGFANVAKIAGTPLAEGGIVFPRPGGTQATLGEAGGREAVIPLDSPDGKSALSGLGGNTININAGVIVADQYSVDQFAKKIDIALFNLRRNNLSVSLDGI